MIPTIGDSEKGRTVRPVSSVVGRGGRGGNQYAEPRGVSGQRNYFVGHYHGISTLYTTAKPIACATPRVHPDMN